MTDVAQALTEATPPNLDDFLTLTLGDIVEAPSLMGGMTQENTLLQVDGKTKDSTRFRMTFYGVHIGRAVLTKNDKGAFKWTYN